MFILQSLKNIYLFGPHVFALGSERHDLFVLSVQKLDFDPSVVWVAQVPGHIQRFPGLDKGRAVGVLLHAARQYSSAIAAITIIRGGFLPAARRLGLGLL